MGVATRYRDVGELHGKFVSDGWNVPSKNVACTVGLPVPLDETISAGDNVRVWAHGPLSGMVTTGGDRVRATVPSVSTNEYAELRVTMPSAWLSDMGGVNEERLDTILKEEKVWADEANARWAWARVIAVAAPAVPVVLTAVGKGACGGKNAVDYRITKTGTNPSDSIDAKTVELFFDKLGPLVFDGDKVVACGSVLLSDLNCAPPPDGHAHAQALQQRD